GLRAPSGCVSPGDLQLTNPARRMTMISLLSSWLHPKVRSIRRGWRPRPARRPVCKPLLEVLESRTVLSSWSTVAPMDLGRTYLAAAADAAGRVYAIGWFDGQTSVTSVEAYNPGTNTWSTVAPLPTPRGHLSATLGADGRIYAIGGFNGHPYLNTVEAYDPGSNSWS